MKRAGFTLESHVEKFLLRGQVKRVSSGSEDPLQVVRTHREKVKSASSSVSILKTKSFEVI